MQQKLFHFFFTTRSGAFGNNLEKEPQKPRQKLKKYVYYIFTENICSACNTKQVVVFCKNVLILQNNDSNFLTHNTLPIKNLVIFPRKDLIPDQNFL